MLTEKDTLVVADLSNSTSDAVFDDDRKQRVVGLKQLRDIRLGASPACGQD
jgi:hypothetical protein